MAIRGGTKGLDPGGGRGRFRCVRQIPILGILWYRSTIESTKTKEIHWWPYWIYLVYMIIYRVAPDIRPTGYPAFFAIRYPAGYPVTGTGYNIISIKLRAIYNIYITLYYYLYIDISSSDVSCSHLFLESSIYV